MATLVSEVIQWAHEDLAVVQPGETISTTLQTAGFTTLNGLLGSLNAERYTAFQQVLQSFNLVAGTSGYTLGSGGTFATTGNLRAQEVTAWNASYLDMRKGGAALPMDKFGAASAEAHKTLAALYTSAALEGVTSGVPSALSAPIPTFVGADTGYPLINVRVWPIPSTSAASIELAYWTPLLAFAAVGTTISLPEGWINMLRYNLAVLLYPRFARLGGLPPELAANAQNSKQSLVQQNVDEDEAQA